LINAIVDGEFPINSNLPPSVIWRSSWASRARLCARPCSACARCWIEIRHGKSTRVRDYWHEGNLAVLGTIARHQDHLPVEFVPTCASA